MSTNFHIDTPNLEIQQALQACIDNKTKPLGALGRLEDVALQIGLIQQTLAPSLQQPTMVVFAGDHGIVHEGVSPYPQEVTQQMVLNFLQGGAAINVFCRQNNIAMRVVDAGVNGDFEEHPNLVNAKIARGTHNFLHQPAMSDEDCEQAINEGAAIVQSIHRDGCNIIGFGEMGIGNTSSAAVLMSVLTDLPIDQCVGKGTGLDAAGVEKKAAILQRAITQHNLDKAAPQRVLSTFGGFEIAMMCGAMLQAAALKMTILVDGFIASAAALVASEINANILAYCIFTHQSEEQGHQSLLKYLDVKPLLTLNMRLGEGSGAAVAYPVVQAALSFLNEMTSFEAASVSRC